MLKQNDEQIEDLDNLYIEKKDGEVQKVSNTIQNQFLSKKNKKKRLLNHNEMSQEEQKNNDDKDQDYINRYLDDHLYDQDIGIQYGAQQNYKQSLDTSLQHKESIAGNDLNKTNDQILLQSMYPTTSRRNTKQLNTQRMNTPSSEADIFQQKRIDLDDFNLTRDLNESRDQDTSILNKQNSSRLEYLIDRGYSSGKDQSLMEKKDEFQINLRKLNELLAIDEEEIIQQNEGDQNKQNHEEQQKQLEQFGDNIFKLSKILENQNDIIEQITSSRRQSQEKIPSQIELENQQKVNESIEKVSTFNDVLKRRKQKRLIGANEVVQYEKQKKFPQQISKIEEILNEEGNTLQIKDHIQKMKEKQEFPSKISNIEEILQNQKTFQMTPYEDQREKLDQNKNQDKGFYSVLHRLDSVLEKNNNYYHNEQPATQDQILNTSLALDANQSRVKSQFIRVLEKDASQFQISKIDLDRTVNNTSMIQIDEKYNLNKQTSQNTDNYYEKLAKLQSTEQPELEKNINSKKSFYHVFFMDSEQNTKLFRDGFSFKSFMPLTSIQFRPPVKNQTFFIGKRKKKNEKKNNMSPQPSILHFILYLLLKIVYKYINIILLFGYIIMILLNDSHSQIGTQILTIFFYFFVQLLLEYFVKQRIQFQFKIDGQECIKYCYKSNQFINVQRGNLYQGDIVKIYKNSRFPADTLLLCTNSSKSTLIVQDFEKIKTKIVPLELKNNFPSCEAINLSVLNGQIKDMPSTFYTGSSKGWKALVKIESLNSFYVSEEHIASRNSILKSEDFVYGIVVLTGIYSTNNGITYEKEVFNSPFYRYYDVIIQIIKFCLLLVVILFRLGLFEVALGTAYTTYFFEKYMLNILGILLAFFPLTLFIALSLVDLIQKKLIQKCEIVKINNNPDEISSDQSSSEDKQQKKPQYMVQVIKEDSNYKKKEGIQILDAQKIQHLGDIQVTVSEIDQILIKSIKCSAISFENIIIEAQNIRKIIESNDQENEKLKQKLVEILQVGILSCNQIQRNKLDEAFIKAFEGNQLSFEDITDDMSNVKSTVIAKESNFKSYKLLYQHELSDMQVNIFESQNGSYRIFVRGLARSMVHKLKCQDDLVYIQNLIESPQFSSLQCYILASKSIDQHELVQIASAFSTNFHEVNEILSKFTQNLTFKCMTSFEYEFEESLKHLQKSGIRSWYLTSQTKINSSFFESEIPTYSFFCQNKDELIQNIDKTFDDLRLKKLEDPILKQIIKYSLPFNIESDNLTFNVLISQDDPTNKFQQEQTQKALIKYYTMMLYAKRTIVWNLSQFDKNQFLLMVKNVLNVQVNFMGIGLNDQDISILGPSQVSVYLNDKQFEQTFYPDIINYSDFIIEDIKDLELLVLSYGRQHFNKTAIIAKQIIERNFTYVFIEILYRFYAGFATQSFFCYKYYLLLEIFFSFGNSIYLMFNFDLSISDQYRYPICYLQSQFDENTSFKSILKSFLRSFYQALAIIFIITEIMKEPIDSSGKIYSHQLISLTAFITFYNYQKIKTVIRSAQLSLSIILLVVDYFIYIGFIYAFCSQYISDMLGTNSVGEMSNFGKSFLAISLSICVAIICSIPDIAQAAYETICSTSPISKLAKDKIQKQMAQKNLKKKTKISIDPTNIQKQRYQNIERNKKIVFVNNKKNTKNPKEEGLQIIKK
ncbi:phospholipid-transporting ATPase, putative (macronuclear) [Tetrahymena thermophila SB210]|uniref:Phospholipid-transporting ATPase, putative n=1 Tax=Tetrahymena thermophila (strain SB210) TaxID=312017 RepID=Q22WA0_TETTS|nr:phospholipid-transporting ATPase, putative [Tetrahymena thermophila SB210]EAR89517.2 phospholipid-transporting ATPase, putative [Tetrahymena thermophila SB210]|eukprot:XP_001009762.2 phospholipid-transporting ATPase, putative [Tetrahymena thermophila SB210]